MQTIETARLVLREPTAEDAAFVLALVTDPDWLRHIGDRGVRTLADARAYIEAGPAASFRTHGFGLRVAELRDGRVPAGLCGLIRRDGLDDAGLGFAFLPAHRGRGLAAEAAAATLADAWCTLGMCRVVAVVSPENAASVRLLARLGFALDGPTEVGGARVDLYRLDAPAPEAG